MAYEFRLPDIGEGVVEGEIVRWLVQEGEEIAEDQPMVEVMTDKATVEIPSPKAGRVKKLLFQVGAKAPVGHAIIEIETRNGETAVTEKAAEKAPRPREVAASSTRTDSARTLATPAIRQYARSRGVDLAKVTATVAGGVISREDIDRLAQAPTTAATPAAPDSAKRIPFVGVRRKIAENMARSKHTAAHFTYVEECDVADLVRLRERAKVNFAERGVRLSYLAFIVKAVVTGLRKVPICNATLDEAKNEIVLKDRYHIGIATATDKGLIVPVLRDADSKTFFALAQEIQVLGEKAKAGKLEPADLGGSTFSISSLGQLGGVLATPIINFPEVAILGVHKIRKAARVVEGKIVVRDVMNLSVSLDHRIVDGYEGAQFLAAVVQVLEDPLSLIELV